MEVILQPLMVITRYSGISLAPSLSYIYIFAESGVLETRHPFQGFSGMYFRKCQANLLNCWLGLGFRV